MASNGDYWQRLSQFRLSRRRVLAGSASLSAGAAAFALVGCGGSDKSTGANQSSREDEGQPKPGGNLTFSTTVPFAGVDPHNSVYGGATLVPLAYNYLLRTSLLAPEEGLIQDLAESQELSPDRLTTTFKIRRNVMINPNGTSVPERALDAEDVRLNFQRMLDPRVASNGFGWLYEWLDKVEAPDKDTFRLVTKAPFAWVPNNIGNNLASPIAPREWLAAPELRTKIVGAGPFVLKEITEGSQAVMERNPAYWRQPRPYLDRFVLKSLKDAATVRTAFLSGQVDEYAAQNPDEAMEIQRVRKDTVYYRNPTLSSMVSFWMNVRVKPWDDGRVRRAVLRATNRDEYVQLIARGAGVHVGLVSPFLKGYALPDAELKKLQPFDVAEAKRLFEAAGVKELSFVHPVNLAGEYVDIFVRQMRAAGVAATAAPMDPAAWVSGMFQSKHSASLTINQEYANPDLALHFHATRGITGTGSYDTGFSNPEVDDAIKRAAANFDDASRKNAYLELQKLIYSKDPAVFFLFTKELDLLQVDSLKGVRRGVGSLWTAFAAEYWLNKG
jgi:peptide/nickel transport system substrate-binding protein